MKGAERSASNKKVTVQVCTVTFFDGWEGETPHPSAAQTLSPQGEGLGWGCVQTPSPQGEGLGWGCAQTPSPQREGLEWGCAQTPSPQGEGLGWGCVQTPSPQGEGLEWVGRGRLESGIKKYPTGVGYFSFTQSLMFFCTSFSKGVLYSSSLFSLNTGAPSLSKVTFITCAWRLWSSRGSPWIFS